MHATSLTVGGVRGTYTVTMMLEVADILVSTSNRLDVLLGTVFGHRT